MTIPKHENEDDRHEYHYPYVLPEITEIISLSKEDSQSLTPLENAFLLWYFKLNNAEESVNRLIHPAHYFEIKTHGHKILLARPHVQDIIKKARQDLPYLKLYSVEYMAKLLHEEVENLRIKNRKERFHGPAARPELYGKVPHREEMLEVDMLLRCLEILERMVEVRKNSDASTTQPSNENRSIDRVLTEAQAFINGRKVVDGRQSGENT